MLPLPGGGLPPARQWVGFVLVAAGLPGLTAVLTELRGTLSLDSVLLLYLLAVVTIAVVGGMAPAVVAALASFLLVNWFLIPPYHTFVVERQDSVVALVVFTVVAVAVSVTVDLAARRRVAAARSHIEAELLSRLTAEPVAATSLPEVLERVRTMFGLTSVALLERRGDVEHAVSVIGPPLTGRPVISVAAGPGLRLLGEGPRLFAEDRRLLGRLARAAGRAVEGQRLAGEAAHARELAEVDRLRSALLAAVGHDLRTPLATIKAAVSSLRQHDIEWTPAEQGEFFAAIEESADRLDHLIANLLDMSRLEAGALSVDLRPVALDEVVATALIGLGGADVAVRVPDDLPLGHADPGLLERVVANLVANARQFSPSDAPVRVEAGVGEAGTVRLRIVDHGPGLSEAEREHAFVPFQRLDDRTDRGGIGLGLAIARGFTEAMGGTLTPSETPGGGLTMTVTVPEAP